MTLQYQKVKTFINNTKRFLSQPVVPVATIKDIEYLKVDIQKLEELLKRIEKEAKIIYIVEESTMGSERNTARQLLKLIADSTVVLKCLKNHI